MQVSWIGQQGQKNCEVILKWARDVQPFLNQSYSTIITINLIGQEWSSDCISLYFIFNERRFVFMRGGDIHGSTSFVILCNASMKRNGQSTTNYTLLYTQVKRQRFTYILRLY